MRSLLKQVHGPYYRKDGRQHVVIIYKDGRRRTVSYPKFLVEYLLDRELDPFEETVDHIDNDFTNNNWDNLRIVRKPVHASEDRVQVKHVYAACIWCGKIVAKCPSLCNRSRKLGKAGPFCSASCSGKYGAEVQNRRLKSLPPQAARRLQYERREKKGGIKVSTFKVANTMTEADIRVAITKLP